MDKSQESSEAESESIPDFVFSPQGMDATPDTDESTSDSSQEPSRGSLEIGLHASEGFDTNPAGVFSSSQLSSIGHYFGSLNLRRIRPRSETAVAYFGGATVWDGSATTGHYNQQELTAHQSIHWSRGALLLRDSLHYLGEGDLARVSVPVFVETNGSLTANSDDQISEISHQAYVTHASSADLVQALTRRFSALAGVSYGFTNYLGKGDSGFDSRQASIFAGFNHRLSEKNNLGITYRFQNLEYPNSNVGHLFANSAILTFHRVLSGRMDFVVGAGPQLVSTGGGTGPGTSQINASAQASFLYFWRRSGATVTYNRVVTSGADVYAGANDNIISGSAFRNISRFWRATVSAGYTQSAGINLVSAAIPANSYRYVFLDGMVTHRFGSSLSGFVSYQFNNESFANCSSLNGCNDRSRRQSVLIGLDWSIRHIPLD